MANTLKTVHKVALEKIQPSPHRYSRSGMPCDRKLAYIIKARGQTQAILVREIHIVAQQVPVAENTVGEIKAFDHYEIIDGHRICDALKANGSKSCTIVSVGEVDDHEAIMMMVERNESRTIELEHVKLAQMFVRLTERYSPEEIASRIGWTQEEVDGFRRLVDPEFMKRFSEGQESDQVELFSETDSAAVEEMR